MFFYPLLIFCIVVTALLWRATDRRAWRLPRWIGWPVRLAFGCFYAAVLGYTLIPLSKPLLENEPLFPPDVWATVAYLWFPFVLQMTIGVIVAGWVVRTVWRRLTRRRRGLPQTDAAQVEDAKTPAASTAESSLAADHVRLSRRDALALTALAVPPVATAGLTIIARQQAGEFGVRRLELPLPTLPPDLDGLRIVHVTDIHIGNFFDEAAVDRLIDTVNSLAADMVAFSGDLLDRGLLQRLPIGLKFLNGIDRRHGFAMVEGNHDLHKDPQEFEAAMYQAQMPLLLDGELTFSIPGRSTPVQMLGVSWGDLKLKEGVEIDPDDDDPPRPIRDWTPAWAASTVARVSAMRRADAFPILLAHHPHTITPAADAGLPLVLSGHTHGGQIMLNETVGAGPLRFKYWRGTHIVGNSRLVICNGVGSWFPLRVNAPAEVLHLTLRRGG